MALRIITYPETVQIQTTSLGNGQKYWTIDTSNDSLTLQTAPNGNDPSKIDFIIDTASNGTEQYTISWKDRTTTKYLTAFSPKVGDPKLKFKDSINGNDGVFNMYNESGEYAFESVNCSGYYIHYDENAVVSLKQCLSKPPGGSFRFKKEILSSGDLDNDDNAVVSSPETGDYRFTKLSVASGGRSKKRRCCIM